MRTGTVLDRPFPGIRAPGPMSQAEKLLLLTTAGTGWKQWRPRSPWPSGHCRCILFITFSFQPKSSGVQNCFFISPATWYKTSRGVIQSDPRHTWGPLLGGPGGFLHRPRRKAGSPLCGGLAVHGPRLCLPPAPQLPARPVCAPHQRSLPDNTTCFQLNCFFHPKLLPRDPIIEEQVGLIVPRRPTPG